MKKYGLLQVILLLLLLLMLLRLLLLQMQHPLLLAGSNKPVAAEKAEEAATANKGVARPVKMSNYFAKMLQNSRERGLGKKQIQKQIESPYSSSYTKKRNDK